MKLKTEETVCNETAGHCTEAVLATGQGRSAHMLVGPLILFRRIQSGRDGRAGGYLKCTNSLLHFSLVQKQAIITVQVFTLACAKRLGLNF